MTGRLLRIAAAMTLALAILLAPLAPARAQSQEAGAAAPAPGYKFPQADREYTRGKPQFPNVLAPYSPIQVQPPVLTNSPRVEQLIHDGKIQITLQDAISLALENNLDIAVQRYNPWIADTDILRALGGGATRGLAGTGTASVLGTIPSENFDPQFTSTVSVDHRNNPVNNPFQTGAGVGVQVLATHTTQANFQYAQGFHTGTALAVTWNNTRSASSSRVQLFNPAVNSTLFVSFTQQLLNGFGLLANTRFIRIAKNSKKITELAFAQQVITTVTAVENLYWEVVFAREDVRVKQRSVDLAKKLYNDNKRQVEIGTLAPIEVVRAEAEVARATQDLIVAQSVQFQQQTLLKNAITKNPLAPAIQSVEIIPTDAVSKQVSPAYDVPFEEAIKEAYTKRPDLLQQQLDLVNRDINVRATRNALLPTLALFGQYGWSGLSGNSLTPGSPTGALRADTTSPIVDATGTRTGAFTSLPVLNPSVFNRAGLGDALGSVFGGDFPTYSLQFNLSIPIRNRPAQADNARALLEQRQTETRLRQLQNGVVVEVRNAQIALEQNRARVEAAQKSRILAEQTLDAEEKKYQLGASTIFFVIQAQRDLANAQSVELRALVDLAKAKVDFERALGRTLEVNRITMADAKGGQVPRDTMIPGTHVTGELVGIGERKTY